MIKRILVALDPDNDTTVATQYAAELAKKFAATVSGIAIVHTQRIAAEVGPGGAVGGLYYAEKLRSSLMEETRQTARRLLDAFEEHLDEAGVRSSVQVREGVPYRGIMEEMKLHDLLIIGRSPHFFYPQPTKKTKTLARVVKEGVSPTLVVPSMQRDVRHVMVAYDGSDASARTVQRFAQLQPFGIDVNVELVHVCGWVSEDVRRRSEYMLARAAQYLRAHGFERVRETSIGMDAPDRRILSYAEEVGTDLIVAGAHSVSAVNRLTFGSTTHALLEKCEVPFFMYH